MAARGDCAVGLPGAAIGKPGHSGAMAHSLESVPWVRFVCQECYPQITQIFADVPPVRNAALRAPVLVLRDLRPSVISVGGSGNPGTGKSPWQPPVISCNKNRGWYESKK